MKISKQNNTFDAFLLAFMRIMTILVNMLSTAILSRNLSLDSYGTYASANLLVNLFTNMTQLGLMDATNYYYHQKNGNRQDNINTIFLIQICIGVVCAGVILSAQREITVYFSNPGLTALLGFLALRPMLGNLFSSMLVLQMAVGKARVVAVRNALMALAKFATVLITSYITKDVATIFAAYLILDSITLAFFYYVFLQESFLINPLEAKPQLIGPIMRFAVPMGIYTMTNSLSRDMDKLVIGYFENTQTMAVYSNCATLLPFDIVSAAFLTIIIPIMTQLIHNAEYERGSRLFRSYLRVGMITTFIFTGICIVLAEEVILLLYGAKYLEGKAIFILYTLVDMAKFAGVSLVLSAKGCAKTLMVISLTALASNTVLNFALYGLLGLLGPAIATVIVTLGTTVYLLSVSSKILQIKLNMLIGWKHTSGILVRLLVAVSIGAMLRTVLKSFELYYIVVLIVCGITVCGIALLLCRKDITEAFCCLNQERVERNNGGEG